MATLKRYNALANVDLAPVDPISRKRTFPAVRDRQRMLGTTTTSGQTPRQVADQAAFDQSMGFTSKTPAPALNQLEDPYALNYAENTTGTFGSKPTEPMTQRPIPRAIPVAPGTGGLAVRATGNSSALDAAGASATPALNQVAYKPTSPAFTPLPAAVPTPTPVATPAAAPAVTPGPVATSAALPTPIPGVTPTPTPTATPSATPTATPQIQPTPVESAGRLVAAGVSNSQAAGFEQPTAQSPIPKTPTSPVLDVNEFDSRKKNRFTGF